MAIIYISSQSLIERPMKNFKEINKNFYMFLKKNEKKYQ